MSWWKWDEWLECSWGLVVGAQIPFPLPGSPRTTLDQVMALDTGPANREMRFLDTSPSPGSKWGMLALIVKALQALACG